MNAHWEKKKEGCGERALIQRQAILVPCMLNVGVGESQKERQRKVSCEGVSFILLSILDNADTEVFCSWKPVGIDRSILFGGKKKGIQGNYHAFVRELLFAAALTFVASDSNGRPKGTNKKSIYFHLSCFPDPKLN